MIPISAHLGYFWITNKYVQSDYISRRIESNPIKKSCVCKSYAVKLR
jgi:hypothetical protein